MVEPPSSTGERPVSKAKQEVMRETKRIEEGLLYSSKGHFSASLVWSWFHYVIGIPMVLLASIAGASALGYFDPTHLIANILTIIVAALSAMATFLNPNEKVSLHLSAGNSYDALMNKVRIFREIDCWRDESEQVLTERLKHYSEQKDELNRKSPQIPFWAYWMAKRGIRRGEGQYTVDKEKASETLL